jgi:hypothetical protein
LLLFTFLVVFIVVQCFFVVVYFSAEFVVVYISADFLFTSQLIIYFSKIYSHIGLILTRLEMDKYSRVLFLVGS